MLRLRCRLLEKAEELPNRFAVVWLSRWEFLGRVFCFLGALVEGTRSCQISHDELELELECELVEVGREERLKESRDPV